MRRATAPHPERPRFFTGNAPAGSSVMVCDDPAGFAAGAVHHEHTEQPDGVCGGHLVIITPPKDENSHEPPQIEVCRKCRRTGKSMFEQVDERWTFSFTHA